MVSHSTRAIQTLRLCVLAALSWFGAGAVEAQAHPAPGPQFQNLAAAITIERGATCLDPAELVEHVSSWLGADRLSAPLAIEVHGSPYFARTVWFRIRRGAQTLAERRFEPAPERCDDLHAAVGLAIALALKASLLDTLIGAHAPSAARAHHPYRLVAQALGGIAVVPGADFAIALGLQRALAEHFAVRLSLLALLGPRGDFQQDQGRFETALGLGRLDVCSRLVALHGSSISACVGIAAGALYASGEAFPMSRHALAPYVAVANALELDLALGAQWSLPIALDLFVPLRRTRFAVRDDAGAVLATHDLASVGAMIALGLAYHF